MSDPRRGDDREEHATMADIIDLAGRRIMSGLIVAGLAVGIGLYAQPGPAKYQVVATEKGFLRLNTSNGYVTACEAERCWRALRPGAQDIGRRPERQAVPAPAAQPRLSAPAVSPQAQEKAPAPAPAAGGNAQ